MRVLQLISSGGFYGAENVVLELGNELQKVDGIYPTIGVIRNSHNPHVELVERAVQRGMNAIVCESSGRMDIMTTIRLRNIIMQGNYDVVHSHGYKANILALLATSRTRSSNIATCHNWLGESKKMKTYATLDRLFLRYFDCVVAVSGPVMTSLKRAKVSPKKVSLIRNGVPVERFNNLKDRELTLAELGINSGPVIGCVGRLSKEKGHIHLIRAFHRVKEFIPEATLLLVGDGALRSKLEKEAGTARIIFAGKCNNVERLYQCMDVFCLPSLTEGLPMALLEAMASGVPSVLSNVGQIPEVVKDGHEAYLVPPGDESSLVEKLVSLLSSSSLRKNMSERAMKKVNRNFTSSNMAKAYLGLYRGMVKQR